MSNDVKIEFDKAKINIMSDKKNTFITTVLFSLNHTWDTNIPTAGTDGKSLLINPDFFLQLPPKQRVTLLLHETWHVAFQHMLRGKLFDKLKFNCAADYVINLMLEESGFTPIDNWLYDKQYKDMSTEQVYALLPDTPVDYIPDVIYPSEASEEDLKKIQYDIEDILVKAATQASAAGQGYSNIPTDILREIQKLTNPKLPWNIILQNYMTQFSKEDYSWKRPNRRFMPEFYLPSLYSESIADLALAFDCSGSVSTPELSAYYSETRNMRSMLNPTITTIVDFDTEIHNIYKLSMMDSMDNIEFNGGGGTNLTPVFDYFKENKPSVLIVFSDLECRPIKEDPGFPVIWIAVQNPNAKVNFGTIIHYDTKI